MKVLKTIVWVMLVGAFIGGGCSREDREEAIDRIGKAGKALNGEVRPDSVVHDVPNIVFEAQRQERIRQNTTWTAENRALHPKEYCQSQLSVLRTYASQLDVAMHKLLVKQSAVKNDMDDAEIHIANLTNLLAAAKLAYKTSMANGSSEVVISGFNLSIEQARKKMVHTNQKIPAMKAKVKSLSNALNLIAISIDRVRKEQGVVASLIEKVQSVLGNLELKDVIAGDESIVRALDAINNNLSGLGADSEDPSVEVLSMPSEKQMIDDEFKKLMAE